MHALSAVSRLLKLLHVGKVAENLHLLIQNCKKQRCGVEKFLRNLIVHCLKNTEMRRNDGRRRQRNYARATTSGSANAIRYTDRTGRRCTLIPHQPGDG